MSIIMKCELDNQWVKKLEPLNYQQIIKKWLLSKKDR